MPYVFILYAYEYVCMKGNSHLLVVICGMSVDAVDVQYAKRQNHFNSVPVRPTEHSELFLCEDDIYRHYHVDHYINEDNTTCSEQPGHPFTSPGYGGSFDGMVRVREQFVMICT